MPPPRILGPVRAERPQSLLDLIYQNQAVDVGGINPAIANAAVSAPTPQPAQAQPKRSGFGAAISNFFQSGIEQRNLRTELLRKQLELANANLPAETAQAGAQARFQGELESLIGQEQDPDRRFALARLAVGGPFRPVTTYEPGPAELAAYQSILGMKADEARQALIGQREERQSLLGASIDNFLIQQRLRAGVEEERQKRAIGPSPASIGDVNALRDDFRQDSKAYVTIRDSWKRLQSVVKEPSAAGDLALLFNYMKILDPGSVVRESEFANAESAASIPDRIRGQWERVRTGQRLAPEVREDFVKQAANLVQAQEGLQRRLESQYGSIAQRFGIRPEDVVIDYAGDPDVGSGNQRDDLSQIRDELKALREERERRQR